MCAVISTDAIGVACRFLHAIECCIGIVLKRFDIRAMFGEHRDTDAARDVRNTCFQFEWAGQIGNNSSGDLFHLRT